MNPSVLAIRFWLGWVLLGGLCLAVKGVDTLWLGYGALLILVSLVDAGLYRRIPTLLVSRELPKTASLGAKLRVIISLENQSNMESQIEIFDSVPNGFSFEGFPNELKVPARKTLQMEYAVRATERGDHEFARVFLRQSSLLRLWQFHRRGGAQSRVRVYPDFRAVSHFALKATGSQLDAMGIHRRRRRGEGRDFHQLRDYRFGDALRHIDWRATQRMQRTIAREYCDERDQQVVFLMDHGRSMHSLDGDLSHLDHSLNAMLLLAWVALRQGDAVGLMTFPGEERWLAPRKGRKHLTHLLNATFDLQSTLTVSDFHVATETLLARLSRRSLVVVLTNVRDDPDDDLLSLFKVLARKHLVLLASLRDEVLSETLNGPCDDLDDALRIGATHLYLSDRRKLHESLRESHLQVFDTPPKNLAAGLVNRYLDIKQAGVL